MSNPINNKEKPDSTTGACTTQKTAEWIPKKGDGFKSVVDIVLRLSKGDPPLRLPKGQSGEILDFDFSSGRLSVVIYHHGHGGLKNDDIRIEEIAKPYCDKKGCNNCGCYHHGDKVRSLSNISYKSGRTVHVGTPGTISGGPTADKPNFLKVQFYDEKTPCPACKAAADDHQRQCTKCDGTGGTKFLDSMSHNEIAGPFCSGACACRYCGVSYRELSINDNVMLSLGREQTVHVYEDYDPIHPERGQTMVLKKGFLCTLKKKVFKTRKLGQCFWKVDTREGEIVLESGHIQDAVWLKDGKWHDLDTAPMTLEQALRSTGTFINPYDQDQYFNGRGSLFCSAVPRRRLPALPGSTADQSWGITPLLMLLALVLMLLWFIVRRFRTGRTKRRCSLADLEANLQPGDYLQVD